ncbi:MAG: hypothetical protein IPK61_14220 [Saprospiraceae bacterium]|nr:hypothetical protein [Saprospiraceae bacterium]
MWKWNEKTLVTVFDIIAGGDVPKEAFSEIETEEFKIPILSNGMKIKRYMAGLTYLK